MQYMVSLLGQDGPCQAPLKGFLDTQTIPLQLEHPKCWLKDMNSLLPLRCHLHLK